METLDISVNIKYSKYSKLLEKERKLEISRSLLKKARKIMVVDLKNMDDEHGKMRDIETILKEDSWALEVILVNQIDEFLKE